MEKIASVKILFFSRSCLFFVLVEALCGYELVLLSGFGVGFLELCGFGLEAVDFSC